MNWKLFDERDKYYNVSTEEEQRARASLIPTTTVDPLVDYWTKGHVLQLAVQDEGKEEIGVTTKRNNMSS